MRTSEDILPDEWLSFNAAAEAVADIMLRFDGYVSNSHGACDVDTMVKMMTTATRLYNEALV